MRRTSMDDANCPVARSLDAIGDWWTLLIVREAFNGARRFGDFQKGLGLAKNILSSRLKQMVAQNILELRPASDGSAYKEYHLTDKGLQLRIVLVALRQWGADNLFSPGEPMLMLVDKKKGAPLRRLSLTAQDGRALAPTEVVVKDGVAGEVVDGSSFSERGN
ncbi:MAG: helix-turn-helix domain-containing protein [Dongiaceae bacterium]